MKLFQLVQLGIMFQIMILNFKNFLEANDNKIEQDMESTLDELSFRLNKEKNLHKRRFQMSNKMEEFLERIMNNLIIIEQYNQDYMDQSEKVVECKTQLIMLKNELNMKEANDFDVLNFDVKNKNSFQTQHEILADFSNNESFINSQNNDNKVNKQEIDLLFKSDEMFENVGKHLIDYLK
jgi:hypothetical protein